MDAYAYTHVCTYGMDKGSRTEPRDGLLDAHDEAELEVVHVREDGVVGGACGLLCFVLFCFPEMNNAGGGLAAWD